MEILVVGGSGFLGRELVRLALTAGHRVVATYFDHPVPLDVAQQRVDVRRRDDVLTLARAVRPDLVVNAAYRQADWATTANGGAHVGVAAAAAGARLVHVSSDVVFSGAASSYDETAMPDPITPYGAAKAAAETAIAAVAPSAVIARTSLIVGHGASQHERFLHRLAADPAGGVLFTDDVRCPVHVTDLASALLELGRSSHAGVHHVAGADAVSRHELGTLIGRRDGLHTGHLRTARRADVGPPAPLDVRLDGTSTQAKLTTRLRGAREFLARRP
ncbi:SDR family oxidoreductase [Cryptosporangium sp. NPDC051539]|uniref:SDR family oxidoreductase n=1 Tax=Cryptosporangium sp. NPDC051539 TaxID=3363962 RepID=UPI00379297D0